MTQVRQIKIQGYKSIRELDLQLNSMNVVIGANGAGKSNMISFLQILQAFVTGTLDTYIEKHMGASHLLYHGQERTSSLVASLLFENEETFQYDLRLAINDKKSLSVQLEEGTNGQLTTIYQQIADWQFYRFHQSTDLSVVNKLYEIYQHHPMHYKRIVATLKQILPFFDDFIWPDCENSYRNAPLSFYWREKESSMIFNTSHMSDGMVRMISLITLLLQPSLPPLICIDEPELGLHPYAINVLACLLNSVSLETQLIVSTQSVTLLNEFDIQDVIVVNRREGQSTFDRLSEEDFITWLQDYSLGELWEKNILGGRPSS